MLGKWDGVPEWQWFLNQNVLTPQSFTLLLTTYPRLALQSLRCSRSEFEPAPISGASQSLLPFTFLISSKLHCSNL